VTDGEIEGETKTVIIEPVGETHRQTWTRKSTVGYHVNISFLYFVGAIVTLRLSVLPRVLLYVQSLLSPQSYVAQFYKRIVGLGLLNARTVKL